MGGGAVLWRSFYHKPTPPQGQEARFVCRGLGFEEIVPQETLAPALFSSSLVELTAPVHPFFSSPSRVCREELKTWVLVLRPSSTRGLLMYTLLVPPWVLVSSSVQTKLDLLSGSVFVQPAIPHQTPQYYVPRILRWKDKSLPPRVHILTV